MFQSKTLKQIAYLLFQSTSKIAKVTPAEGLLVVGKTQSNKTSMHGKNTLNQFSLENIKFIAIFVNTTNQFTYCEALLMNIPKIPDIFFFNVLKLSKNFRKIPKIPEIFPNS
jgi:hypothetical protein